MTDWSPASYLRFEDERTRPASDLLAQVRHTSPRRVVDLGCGPGNSTELLATRFPDAEVVGVDLSPAMVAEARRRLPHLRFERADAGLWTPGPETDLVFSNAALHLVPDHLGVMERLLASLPAGSTLAVQMPDNVGELSHRLMSARAEAGPYARRLQGAAREPLPPVGVYYDRLRPLCRRLDLWHTVYSHPLAGHAAIVDWLRSTALRPFLEPLDAAEQGHFLAAYQRALAGAYPLQADGSVLLRFPRLFLMAER